MTRLNIQLGAWNTSNKLAHFSLVGSIFLISFTGSSSWTNIIPSGPKLDPSSLLLLFFIYTLSLGKLICFYYSHYFYALITMKFMALVQKSVLNSTLVCRGANIPFLLSCVLSTLNVTWLKCHPVFFLSNPLPEGFSRSTIISAIIQNKNLQHYWFFHFCHTLTFPCARPVTLLP